MTSIKVDHISKRFQTIQALDDVSVELYPGQCAAMIGPNGCGKTTLIKSILGLVIPDHGNILVNNRLITEDPFYRTDIGYMSQIGRYPDHMKVSQVFDLISKIRTPHHTMDFELYESYHLSQYADQYMYTLSGGTRQKISAALAFLYNPFILILDEPTSGLDPLSAEILKAKIKKVNYIGKLVLITSHILSDLDELCTHILYMQEGKLILNKTIDQLKNETQEEKISKMISNIMKQQKAKAIFN